MYVLKHVEENIYFRKRNSCSGGISIVDKLEKATTYSSAGKAKQSISSPTSKFYLSGTIYSSTDFEVREVEIKLI